MLYVSWGDLDDASSKLQATEENVFNLFVVEEK